ncbi:MAG: hypothetical protein FVQ83_06070 [Chloroflexi bacterium]|nr:hypothetical protein [Chloroflexota bacterium]
MLTPENIINLPYSSELTRAGITYVSRRLPWLSTRKSGSDFDKLRSVVAEKAVELAFRRYLVSEQVPHQAVESTSFTELDYFDIALGGRRCNLITALISRKKDVHKMQGNPELILGESGLVPKDRFVTAPQSTEDIFIFAFLSGLVMRRWDQIQKAHEAGQQHYLFFPLPQAWSQPTRWVSFGSIALKSDNSETVKVELGGQDFRRAFCSEELNLAPRQRVAAQVDYHAITHLHIDHAPDGTVGVHSPILDKTVLIQPRQWRNLWVYGQQIRLVGYLPRSEYLNRAKHLPPGSQVIQASGRTTEQYLTLPVKELRPISDLFDRARRWAHR